MLQPTSSEPAFAAKDVLEWRTLIVRPMPRLETLPARAESNSLGSQEPRKCRVFHDLLQSAVSICPRFFGGFFLSVRPMTFSLNCRRSVYAHRPGGALSIPVASFVPANDNSFQTAMEFAKTASINGADNSY